MYYLIKSDEKWKIVKGVFIRSIKEFNKTFDVYGIVDENSTSFSDIFTHTAIFDYSSCYNILLSKHAEKLI